MAAHTEPYWCEYRWCVSGVWDLGTLVFIFQMLHSYLYILLFRAQNEVAFSPVFTAVGEKRKRRKKPTKQQVSILYQHNHLTEMEIFRPAFLCNGQFHHTSKIGLITEVMITVVKPHTWQTMKRKLYRARLVVWVCSNKLVFHMVTCKTISQIANDGHQMDGVMEYRPERNDWRTLQVQCEWTTNMNSVLW